MYVQNPSAREGFLLEVAKTRMFLTMAKSPLPVRVFAFWAERLSPNIIVFGNPQKVIHIDTILILVYIHTQVSPVALIT